MQIIPKKNGPNTVPFPVPSHDRAPSDESQAPPELNIGAGKLDTGVAPKRHLVDRIAPIGGKCLTGTTTGR